jgi:tetratricopeptide (TPR) repeat protein
LEHRGEDTERASQSAQANPQLVRPFGIVQLPDCHDIRGDLIEALAQDVACRVLGDLSRSECDLHGIPWRERRLIEANWDYARGAARESQRAYQEILQRYPDDIDALFGLGLLGFEYRWLLGGPASAYKPPLVAFLRSVPDHLVALEALRNLEAEDRNCAAADALNHKMHPTGVPWMSRAIAVFCGPPSEAQQALLRAPGEWPKALAVARLRVAGIAQNPRAAAALARAMVERTESEAALPGPRAAALLALAELELTLGHLKSADEVFARLELVNPHWALADSTYQLLAAHRVTTGQQLRPMQDRLTRWRAESVPPDQGGDFVVRHNGVHAHLRTYLLGRISALLGEYDAARRFAGDLDRMDSPQGAGSVARDLAHSVRAHVFNRQGRYEEALHALESAPREVPFNRRGFSWAFVLPQDRFLRAELLARLGRYEEALWWYQSLEYHPDAVLAGPAHLGQAKTLERLGRRQQAIDQYKRLLELWPDCDAEFQPLVEEARTGLRRLGAG